MTLRITSCMSEANDPVCFEIADYLRERTGMAIDYVQDLSWDERLEAIARGRIDVAWICSLPYVIFADDPGCKIELLGVPVMAGPQYEGQPVYFSEVIVRADSPYESFEALRGSRFTFNETGSLSGYYIMLHHLKRIREELSYFGTATASGAHTQSVKQVLDGRADCAAVDSMVLDVLIEEQPDLLSQFRSVQRLGPNPIPPWIVSSALSAQVRQELSVCLHGMTTDPVGKAVLARGGMQGMACLDDRDYDSVRVLRDSVEVLTGG
jgi:phosphonate transport system substrate-binding protein